MVNGARKDLTTSHFWIELEGVLVAAFRECAGLSAEIEVTNYAEGGLNVHEHKLAGRVKYGNVTLRKGVAQVGDLWGWFDDFAAGKVQRRNISIVMYEGSGREKIRWDLTDVYPVKWQGPDLKAEDNALAVESLELAHCGFKMTVSNE